MAGMEKKCRLPHISLFFFIEPPTPVRISNLSIHMVYKVDDQKLKLSIFLPVKSNGITLTKSLVLCRMLKT